MPLVYKICGGGDIPAHICNPCISTENGNVRSIGLIDATLLDISDEGLIEKAQVEALSFWEKGVTDGKIHIVPNTRGTFDGGSPVSSAGFGDVKEIVTGKDFTLVFNDPNHKENEAFYAAIANAPGAYHIAWRTDTELRISGTAVNIDPVDNTEEDPTSAVLWTVTATWTQKRKTVQIFDLVPVKKIFNCFEVED